MKLLTILGEDNDVTFQWKTTEYNYFSMPNFVVDPSEAPTPGKQLIIIEYIDMVVDINYEVQMVDINTFISNIGGALGLFLGFSIIDFLIYFYRHVFEIN